MKTNIDKSQILTRIKEHKKLLNDTELADFLGINKSTLSNWYKRNSIDYDLVFSKCEHIDLNWLLTGKSDNQKGIEKIEQNTACENTVLYKPQSKAIEKFWNEQEVPLYELDAAAGLQTIFSNQQQNIINFIKIPDLPKCDGAIYARGDSMYPLLKSGDIVIFKEVKELNHILFGEMYLVDYTWNGDDYLVIKYIQRSEIEKHIKLASYNTHHEPLDIPIDSIRSMAIIKASVRLNTLK